MPQFVFDPKRGETYQEALDLAGNPNRDRDWRQITSKLTDRTYQFTVAHYANTEARFRRHIKPAKDVSGMVHLDDMLLLITQDDVVQRYVLDQTKRSYVEDFGVYIEVEDSTGAVKPLAISRQMVLFAVERRKSWRMLQSEAGIDNVDYVAQKQALESFDEDGVSMADRIPEIRRRFDEALAASEVSA